MSASPELRRLAVLLNVNVLSLKDKSTDKFSHSREHIDPIEFSISMQLPEMSQDLPETLKVSTTDLIENLIIKLGEDAEAILSQNDCAIERNCTGVVGAHSVTLF